MRLNIWWLNEPLNLSFRLGNPHEIFGRGSFGNTPRCRMTAFFVFHWGRCAINPTSALIVSTRSWGEVDVGVDVTLMSLKRPWLLKERLCLPTFWMFGQTHWTPRQKKWHAGVKDDWTPLYIVKIGSQLSSNWWLFKDTLVKQYLGVAILVMSTNLLAKGMFATLVRRWVCRCQVCGTGAMGKGSNVYRPDTWHAAPRHFLQRKEWSEVSGT